MARFKMEPGIVTTSATIVSGVGTMPCSATTTSGGGGGTTNHMIISNSNSLVSTSGNQVTGIPSLSLGPIDCYEDMFKEITKKLYGEEGIPDVIDAGATTTTVSNQSIVLDQDLFRTDGTGLTFVTTTANGLPPGTIVLQKRVTDDKGLTLGTVGEHLAIATTTTLPQQQQTHQQQPVQIQTEERWFESEDILDWTTSKIARYNPSQKVFRCVDCDFVGFLSRVAEHWLGNHASLRVFQCPKCPYTSAWARCVRMHLSRQHGETQTDNSLWKENPVLEEVTKFLTGLKTRVEQKAEANTSGEKRYTCPFCTYATDRRDLFNRHENIHRDEKPFQCYVCDKQFNRADHVKKHFTRMHRDHPYDINRIRKNLPKTQSGISLYSNKYGRMQRQQNQTATNGTQIQITTTADPLSAQTTTISGQQVNMQQIPHIAYFNPPATPGHTGPLQGIQGVGGIKKEAKTKGPKKKKQGDKMYTCSYCPWQGVDNWCLKRHLNTHIKPFLCALCDYKAARSERLATHVLKVHNKRVCHKCSFLADDVESLHQHNQDSHQNPLVKTGFNCNVCQEYFELRADLEAHAILEHHKVIVQCDLCDFRTTDELSMEAHLREKHNLQPGMGAVAAAAAAAAAAAQTGQTMQVTQQPSIQIPEQLAIQFQQQQQQHHQQQQQRHQQQQQQQQEQILALAEQLTLPLQESLLVPKVEPMDEDIQKETETLCSTCGCEFPDTRSLKMHEPRHARKFKECTDPRTSKSISRTYTCSTCTYNCATSKTMMQHQRLHTGMELQCKEEICKFSSQFDNSLKEHVHAEHYEHQLRCPHCGVRILSINDFTIHWRNHHSTLCNLCVALYKNKYGLKECDIHELVAKRPYELIAEIQKLFTSEETPTVDENGVLIPITEESKRLRLEYESSIRSINNYFNRDSIKFLPKFNELIVSSLTVPKSKYQRRKWLKKYPQHEKSLKRRRKSLLQINAHLILTRSPLFSSGYKCFLKPGCSNKPWKYSSKIQLILHQIWNHRKPSIKCDRCQNCYFYYDYQLFLHTMRYHPEDILLLERQQQININSNQLQQQLISVSTDNNNIIFKQE